MLIFLESVGFILAFYEDHLAPLYCGDLGCQVLSHLHGQEKGQIAYSEWMD